VDTAISHDLAFILLVLLIGDAQCRHNKLHFVFEAVTVLVRVPCPLKITLQCSADKNVWEPLVPRIDLISTSGRGSVAGLPEWGIFPTCLPDSHTRIHCLSCLKTSIRLFKIVWSLAEALLGVTTPGQRGSGNNDSYRLFQCPQNCGNPQLQPHHLLQVGVKICLLNQTLSFQT